MPTSDNLPPPRTLTNGVVVSPRLQVNEMSIRDWHSRTQFDALYNGLDKPALIALARRMGFSEEQINREFQ